MTRPSDRIGGPRPDALAVLLSGRGSNFLALHEAIERGELPARIAVVVSNRPDAPGLARARELGLETAAVPSTVAGAGVGRDEHERLLREVLDHHRPDWICLAGYMRLLSPDFVGRYPRRIVNVHPSLLPAFPGLHAQRQAVEHGVRVSGCTVHLVDAELDNGPIVVQRAVPVEDGDTEESLAERILVEEHRAYPRALRRLLEESWGIDGRRLVFGGKKSPGSE